MKSINPTAAVFARLQEADDTLDQAMRPPGDLVTMTRRDAEAIAAAIRLMLRSVP
jgi:hypothetical protein